MPTVSFTQNNRNVKYHNFLPKLRHTKKTTFDILQSWASWRNLGWIRYWVHGLSLTSRWETKWFPTLARKSPLPSLLRRRQGSREPRRSSSLSLGPACSLRADPHAPLCSKKDEMTHFLNLSCVDYCCERKLHRWCFNVFFSLNWTSSRDTIHTRLKAQIRQKGWYYIFFSLHTFFWGEGGG